MTGVTEGRLRFNLVYIDRFSPTLEQTELGGVFGADADFPAVDRQQVVAGDREDIAEAERADPGATCGGDALVAIDEPHYRPHLLTANFWKGWEAYRRPTLQGDLAPRPPLAEA